MLEDPIACARLLREYSNTLRNSGPGVPSIHLATAEEAWELAVPQLVGYRSFLAVETALVLLDDLEELAAVAAAAAEVVAFETTATKLVTELSVPGSLPASAGRLHHSGKPDGLQPQDVPLLGGALFEKQGVHLEEVAYLEPQHQLQQFVSHPEIPGLPSPVNHRMDRQAGYVHMISLHNLVGGR
jgi:hypothetical protein